MSDQNKGVFGGVTDTLGNTVSGVTDTAGNAGRSYRNRLACYSMC